MKKYLLLLIVLPLFGKAQTSQMYYPFPDSGALWHVLFESQSSPSNYHAEYIDVSLGGDTIIGSYTYRKIKEDGIYKGALREDTLNKTIFFFGSYFNMGADTETVLYDFNLQVGDTTSVGYLGLNDSPRTVTSIDSILIDGQYRKRYHIYTQGGWNDVWVEGIGSLTYLFLPFDYQFEWHWSLICFSENGVSKYLIDPNDPYTPHPFGMLITNPSCTSGIEQQNERISVKVEPNPFSDILVITPSDLSSQYDAAIIDVLGKQVFHQVIDGETMLNINVPAGIYFLRLTDANGNFSVKKIIRS